MRKFLVQRLRIDLITAEELSLVSLRRYLAPGKKMKAVPLVRVVFSAPNERDLVMGYVSNLPKECYVELSVPDHLMGIRRYMENFAFQLRQKGRDSKSKTSTSIRLDDLNGSLVLGVKREKDNDWREFTREELLKLNYDLTPLPVPTAAAASNSLDDSTDAVTDRPSPSLLHCCLAETDVPSSPGA